MKEKDGRFVFGWYGNEPIYLTKPSDNDLTCNGCVHSYKPDNMYPCYRCIRQVIGDYYENEEE